MEVTNVMEYQAIAKQKLPKMAYDYYASGAEDEWTLNENREAFSRILCALPPPSLKSINFFWGSRYRLMPPVMIFLICFELWFSFFSFFLPGSGHAY
jgi:hypothetical protein